MKPKLSLAGLNTFRSLIALFAGAISVGISVVGQPIDGGQAVADRTLLATLWIYVGATAVPWANLRGMVGSGVTPALTMAAWGVYLAAATSFGAWSAATHPAWRNDRPRTNETRCVEAVTPPPEARDAGVVARPSSPRVAPPRPAAVVPPEAAARPPVAAQPEAFAPTDAVGEEPDARRRSRRRRHRSEGDDRRPPAVWLERDPVRPAPP